MNDIDIEFGKERNIFFEGGREILKIINFWKDLWGFIKVWFLVLG